MCTKLPSHKSNRSCMKFTEAVKREADERQDMISNDKAMTKRTGMWTLSDKCTQD